MDYKKTLGRNTKEELLEIIEYQQDEIDRLNMKVILHQAEEKLRNLSRALKEARGKKEEVKDE